jgi:hypothetical protein
MDNFPSAKNHSNRIDKALEAFFPKIIPKETKKKIRIHYKSSQSVACVGDLGLGFAEKYIETSEI